MIRRVAPQILCFEYDYPDLKGLRTLQKTKHQFPSLPVLMVTEYHSESLAVWAFRAGIWDYLVKPVAVEDILCRLDILSNIVERTGARHGLSLISAITSRGHMRFMIKGKGGVNAAVFIDFLKRLLVGAKRRIFLIVDRYGD